MPDPKSRLNHLTGARTVALGAVWNLAGRLGPLIVAIVATPFLIGALGVARFGIFTLALSLVGMFGIFDFGFGRALTRIIAERIATGEEETAADSVVTGIALLGILGLAGGAIMAALTSTYAAHLPGLDGPVREEVRRGLLVLCLSAPLVIVNAALWGVLSAFQRFAAANLVNVPIMALYYLGPLAAALIVDDFAWVMAVLVLCRVLMTAAYWRICTDAMPAIRHGRVRWGAVLPVLRFGGWITVSSTLWPLGLHLDRFVIAASLSAAATAWYATPFDLILRFTIIPIAIMQTAFPAMTTAHRAAPGGAAHLFRLSTVAITAILLPAALIVVCFAGPLLTLWLGADFAAHARDVLRLLGVGVLFMCADTAPIALLDGIGRPDVNAKISLATLSLHIPILFVLIAAMGIEGAAIAWMGRVIFSYFLRLAIAARLADGVAAELTRVGPMLTAALITLVGASIPMLPSWTGGFVAGGSTMFVVLLWRHALSEEERTYALARLPFRQP